MSKKTLAKRTLSKLERFLNLYPEAKVHYKPSNNGGKDRLVLKFGGQVFTKIRLCKVSINRFRLEQQLKKGRIG